MPASAAASRTPSSRASSGAPPTATPPSRRRAVSPRAASRAAKASRSPVAAHQHAVAGQALHLVDAAGGDDAPLPQHDDRVAGARHVLQHVRGEQHGDAELAREPAHEGEHLLAARGVEPVGGLVQHDQLGGVDQRLGQLGALLHAGREGADEARALLLEAHLEQHLRGAQHRVAARQAAQLGHVHDQVARGHLQRQAVELGHVAQPAADLGRVAGGVDAEHRDPALVRAHEAEQEPS